MKLIKFAMIAALFSVLTSGFDVNPTQAASHGMHKGMMVTDAWARARMGKAKVAGAYVTVHNAGKEDDRLIGAKSAISKRTEIHMSKMTDGVMKMQHVKEGIEVKAGEIVMLKPGGYHVMFMGLQQEFHEGLEFPITLQFEKAGEIDVMVSVKKAGAMGSMNHDKMDHDKMMKMDHDKMKKTN